MTEFLADWKHTFLLDQQHIWIDVHGRPHRLQDMSLEYLRAVRGFVQRDWMSWYECYLDDQEGDPDLATLEDERRDLEDYPLGQALEAHIVRCQQQRAQALQPVGCRSLQQVLQPRRRPTINWLSA